MIPFVFPAVELSAYQKETIKQGFCFVAIKPTVYQSFEGSVYNYDYPNGKIISMVLFERRLVDIETIDNWLVYLAFGMTKIDWLLSLSKVFKTKYIQDMQVELLFFVSSDFKSKEFYQSIFKR